MSRRIEALNGVVPVVFSSREDVEAAVDELRRLGFGDDELGVMIPDPKLYRLIDDTTDEMLKGLSGGALVGASVGSLAGLGVAAFLAPAVGLIGIGGALLIGGLEGALWGAITGAHVGVTAEIKHLEDIARKYQIDLRPNEILVVVVTDSERADKVCDIMQRHNARCIRETVPASAPALRTQPASS